MQRVLAAQATLVDARKSYQILLDKFKLFLGVELNLDLGPDPRELDVLRSVYKGMNNPEIADKLYISINTVKKHLKNIYEKTGTSSRMELVYVINKGETKNTDK
jgi:DNA-binding NarL/FixJ family response regulator